jgi:SAM-dependent methyltransferase
MLAFGARAQEPPVNPPFITTPQDVVDRMLRLAGTGPQDTVMDLGSGDGRIVIAAARDFGARGIGVEINPKLVALSRDNARKAGVAGRTLFEEQDVLKTDLARASVITVYLLPFLIDQLQPRFLDELKPGTRIVTHAFGMKGWNPDRSESVKLAKPQPSQGATSDIHLWIVPAQARGEWQAPGWRLTIHQNFQQVEVECRMGGQALSVSKARLEGTSLAFSGEGFSFRGQVEARRIAGELTRGGETAPLIFTKR